MQVSVTIVLRWSTERRLSTLREELHVRYPVFGAKMGKSGKVKKCKGRWDLGIDDGIFEFEVNF